ncbi:MAG: hypothetical protein H6970_15730 [Gammaproteobacteria bacterium]|nr:hypothetical protein [Gammaproteobacteria bacterium]MCP5459942.1 hypothetical protein [Gammaproteobacteria bacterium]
MKTEDLVNKLAIRKPWKIHRFNMNQVQQTLSVELVPEAKKAGWFSFSKRVACPACGQSVPLSTATQPLTLRHINFNKYTVYLRVKPLQVDCNRTDLECPLRLSSTPGLPYTRRLEQQIRQFRNVPNGAVAASEALQLGPEDLKQLMEAGWLPRPTDANVRPVENIELGIPHSATPTSVTKVDSLLPQSHPVWRKLIDNQIALETRNIGLQCLLVWVKGQSQGNLTETEKLSKTDLVWRYFEKYQHVLRDELNQLEHSGGRT